MGKAIKTPYSILDGFKNLHTVSRRIKPGIKRKYLRKQDIRLLANNPGLKKKNKKGRKTLAVFRPLHLPMKNNPFGRVYILSQKHCQ